MFNIYRELIDRLSNYDELMRKHVQLVIQQPGITEIHLVSIDLPRVE
jgi:hypothetical protein